MIDRGARFGQEGMQQRWKIAIVAAIVAALLLPFVLYGWLCWQRPPQTNAAQLLFQGIAYRREYRAAPRPMMIHTVSIDLTAPEIRAFVTPGSATLDRTETHAQTTTAFVRQFDLQLAINASFFFPFREETPWDFFPHSGDRVSTVGQSIAQSKPYSLAETNWPVLCFVQHRAQIRSHCPPKTTEAVAGSEILVADGKIVTSPPDRDRPYPRTAVAIDRAGEQIWLIAIDGKQPFYSEGATLRELAAIAISLGADAAINLDGGGSTTIAVATSSEVKLLNAPIHTKLPLRQRPVANHLGFYARSIVKD